MTMDSLIMAILFLLAAVVGFLLGLLRREFIHKRQLRDSRTRWERRLQNTERLKSQAREELRVVRDELKDQKSATTFLESTMATTRKTWKKQLVVAELRIEDLVKQLQRAKQIQAAEETRRAEARKITAEVLEDELTTANEQLDNCSRDLSEARARTRQLELQLERSSRQQLAGVKKVKQLETDLEVRRQEVREVRQKLDAQDLLLTTVQQDLAGSHQELMKSEGKLPELRARISELEAQISSTQTLFAVAGTGDDLRKIRGIGPAFERKLNELGVETYLQIAAWDDAEIDRIADRLGGRAAKRIRRDDWVAGARQLLAERLRSS